MPFVRDIGGRYPIFRKPLPPRRPAGSPVAPPPAVPASPDPTPPPGFGDVLGQLLAGLGGAGGGMDPDTGIASAKRALIQYGKIPGGLGNLTNLAPAFGGDVSALADQNTKAGLSILARINQSHSDQQRYITNRLAAHGILGSGETGFQFGREQTNYTAAQADSAQKVLDYLSGINSGIAQYLQWQALMEALKNAGTTPGAPPPPPPAGVTQSEPGDSGDWYWNPNTGQYQDYLPSRGGGGYHLAY